MRQGKPWFPEFVIAGMASFYDPARDIQMRFRVAPIKREAVLVYPEERQPADQGRNRDCRE
jgi:hypothetical protein